MPAAQIKIIKGATLEELEANVNEWMTWAHEEGLAIDYLGSIQVLPNGVFYYVVDYHEPFDTEEEEHHT